jgi:5,10-methylenetetrahydrofolate reductase
MFRTSVSLIVYGDVAEGSISDTDTESSDLLEDLSTDEEETKNIADTVLNERCDQRREAKLLRREDKISVCGKQNFITQFYTNTFV